MFSTELSFALLVIVVLTLRIKVSDAGNFTFGEGGEPFKCNPSGNIFCGGNATSTNGSLALTLVQDSSEDYTFYSGTSGTALTPVSLVLLNSVTNRWDSFKTSFQFRITPDRNTAGDGMTFVMLNVSQYSGKSGGYFGLFDESGQAVVGTLAIEFDTFLKKGIDDDQKHVGIDVDNLTSIFARNASEVGINLTGPRLYSWIEYDSSSQKLEGRSTSIPPGLSSRFSDTW